ncbi:hypothetical protein [Mesorhizobium sp. M2A.F.Ca.ET.039.01.1.1]|uniref:hypothetical protein n=1 Tax=Mesorhizobium sp. M2A.F.Ca.ET.039.01.1.1 TaxID=2496746 RepID=UPI000FCAAB76|nr:hypothetical protein [Mesorhizobium sp. M2A.F.Ca.ET.039.01.1.1]RWX71934.1 hypothetical protein EOA24_04035 [Mesorhizobium sp. M2A.F.Ca.ET.039.01.1.1]TIV37243.1 MAG: hypothetical protein E5V99_07635 [Mesorhizobium sp.]TIV47587.1 MAG: hypothetical protein E5V96_02635 [Mesorhizobium sp.]
MAEILWPDWKRDSIQNVDQGQAWAAADMRAEGKAAEPSWRTCLSLNALLSFAQTQKASIASEPCCHSVNKPLPVDGQADSGDRMRRKSCHSLEDNVIGERPKQFLESTLANRFVSY